MTRLLLLCILLVSGCVPASAKQPAATRVRSVAALQQSTPSPYVAPTVDATLQARVTLANVELLEAQARNAKLAQDQNELDYAMTASAATATQFPPTATQAALLIQYAGQTETQKTAIAGTATPAFATAQALDMQIAREQTIGPVRDWGGAGVLLGAGALTCWLLWLVVQRRRLNVKLLQNELAIQEMEMAQRKQKAMGDRFIVRGDHSMQVISPVVPVGLTAEAVQSIARWVVEHEYTWADDMRRGAGVGISHRVLVAYRDGYLVRAGVLVRVNDRYIVTETGKEYFRRKAKLETENV